MTTVSAPLSYAQMPDLVRLNILEFLSYSELLELHRSDSQFQEDVWCAVRKRVLNEPYGFMIEVEKENFDRNMQGGYEYHLGCRLHTPIICADTLDIDFELKVKNCSRAHESHSAFEEYHKDVFAPSEYGHNLEFVMCVATLRDIDDISIAQLCLQTDELCHSPIEQALSEGVLSDHISLSDSPNTSQIYYTAYWDDSSTAKTYCHGRLIKGDGNLIMVRCDKFRCSLLWWEYAIARAENFYTEEDR